MLWWKTFHIIFVITWFAGVFYLPRLFVYHAQAQDAVSLERFKVMERKLYFGISTPSAVLTLITGSTLWLKYGFGGTWLQYKLMLVLILVLYHLWCFKYLADFKKRQEYSKPYFLPMVQRGPGASAGHDCSSGRSQTILVKLAFKRACRSQPLESALSRIGLKNRTSARLRRNSDFQTAHQVQN